MSLGRYLENKRREFGFSHSALQIIAMLTMLIDHIGFVLIKNGKLFGYNTALWENALTLPEANKWLILYRICRMIGRISFPIFAFLIVEGFRKTSNLFKYMLRILFLALISEIPYDMMVFNELFTYRCLEVQNVLFTYFMGLQMLALITLVTRISEILTIFVAIIFGIICYILRVDYAIEGIILIYGFYIFRSDINLKCIIALIVTFAFTLQNNFGAGILSVIFIYFYDGQKGYINLKRIPYLFYPIHMLVLYGIIYISNFGNR